MLQYDQDMRGAFAEIFQRIRTILLSYSQITEIKNAKQTSYRDAYGVVIMMRTREERLVVAFGRGAVLQMHYPMLQGSGKIVRHLYYRNIDEVDEGLLRAMIEESFVLGMEAEEMKRLRSSWKKQVSQQL